MGQPQRQFLPPGAALLPGQQEGADPGPQPRRQAGSGPQRGLQAQRQRHRRRECAQRNRQPAAQPGPTRARPGHQRAEHHQRHQRQHQRRKDGVEIRRADRQPEAAQHLRRQRVERAQQHGGGGGSQQQVVQQQQRLARTQREALGRRRPVGAPGIQRQRTAHRHCQQRQDEQAARRVARERMDRADHTRAHEEGAEQRQREAQQRQQQAPAQKARALLGHRQRVDQRRAQQPGHEGGVLDRIPEPEPAPAQLVIGPEAAQADAGRQRAPGGQHPGSRPARPARRQLVLQQRGHRKRKAHRKAHIAEVEQRRVGGHAGVLQQRVQVAPLGGRRQQPAEGVGRERDEGQEACRHKAQHALHPRRKRGRQRGAARGHQRTPGRQHPRPQQQRALMPAPGGGDAITQRQLLAGIGRDIGQRGVHLHKAGHQRGQRRAEQHKADRSQRPGQRHPAPLAALGAPQRQHRLCHGRRERQQQRELTELADHGWPAFCSAAAASGGM
mmetsp:Transcript_68794/g.161818  ORF Transcript_68794/g.161818 Transcript_68794/m.161818 type:complete len:499 (+) Transcript_68794:746-2242(+)